MINEKFLADSPNVLRRQVHEAKNLEKIIKVIHVPKSANGATMSVIMDGDADRALAFLKRG